ncbi:MAG: DNA glycosylase, partial [Actinomycetota bacterium]
MKHSRSSVYPSPPVNAAAPSIVPSDRPVLLPLPPGELFDCCHTFRCGQTFRWRRHADSWYGPFGATSLCVRPVP